MTSERFKPMQSLPEESRPRERLLDLGASSLSTSELLAITLRTGSHREDALHLAQSLLADFDGLPGIAKASITELTTVKGIGEVKATEIKAALELGHRLVTTTPEERPVVKSPMDAANLLMSEMSLLEQEHMRVVLLDTRNRVLKIPTIYIGSLNTSVIRVAEVFRTAIRESAAALVVVHNHPSGDPSPSPEDVNTTRSIIQAGQLLDIDVLDHIIIGNQCFASLKEQGLAFE